MNAQHLGFSLVPANINWNRSAGRYLSEAIERDINMIGQPSAQQIVGIDHVNETTIPQGWQYGLIIVFFNIRNVPNR